MYNNLVVKPENYLEAFQEGKMVSIDYKSFDFEQLSTLYEVGSECLNSISFSKYSPVLQVAIKEMVQNAVKATLKRYYFKKNGLDIKNNYKTGMEDFREFMENSRSISLPEGIEYSARIEFLKNKNEFEVKVINFGEMVPTEEKSVKQMISRGKNIASVPELLGQEARKKEGGGIGISMLLILGKPIAPVDKLFSYKIQNGMTEFHLKFPLQEINK